MQYVQSEDGDMYLVCMEHKYIRRYQNNTGKPPIENIEQYGTMRVTATFFLPDNMTREEFIEFAGL